LATAYLLVGHGSRVPGANRVLRRVAAAVRARMRDARVEACFLEAAAPGLPESIERCVAAGARRILVVPYFLYLGGHVGRDLPRAMRRARRMHPGLRIRLAPHLGFDRRLVALVAERVRRGRRAAGWRG
jgi:sirohydrochlorin ferrochelatase